MAISQQHFASSQSLLKNQKGFALVFTLSFLPLLLAAGLAFFYSSFLVKNWMQALHTCRAEMLSTQKSVGEDLEKLMGMNAPAKTLRFTLRATQAASVAALAHLNFPLAAKLGLQLKNIQQQQKILDFAQKALLISARMKMHSGLMKAKTSLSQQNISAQSRLPFFLRFSIAQIQSGTPHLAVKPDSPDLAPVYVLENPFEEKQALHISWKSQFSTKGELQKWLRNSHQKKDSCSASLQTEKNKFSAILTKDRFWSKAWSLSAR